MPFVCLFQSILLLLQGVRQIPFTVWFTENVYFTNAFSDHTYVEVSRLDGSYRTVLLKTTDDQPRVMAVNPIKRFGTI